MFDDFNYGDKVYHKTLDKVGIFIRNSIINTDDAIIRFEDKFGNKDDRYVSKILLTKKIPIIFKTTVNRAILW
jgi:hypothetical protein